MKYTIMEDLIHNHLLKALAASVQEDVVPPAIKDHLHVITSSCDKAFGPLKAVIASVAAKLASPDWDTRLHKVELGGKYSLRSLEHSHVCPLLHSKGLYATATESSLNVTFRANEPYNMTYSANISPRPCKLSFLSIVHEINERYSQELCEAILGYCLHFLKDRKAREDALKAATAIPPPLGASLKTVEGMLNRVHSSCLSHISAFPAIAFHAACEAVAPILWPEGTHIQPLNAHTAADDKTGAKGDVEGRREDGTPFLAAEVKWQIPITPAIIETFDRTSAGVPLRYIITTLHMNVKATDTNIVVCSATEAVIHLLQQALLYSPGVIADYITRLRRAVIENKTLTVTAKEQVAALLA